MDKFSGSTAIPYYFHTNAIGSVTAITDNDGKLIERVAYDDYGKPTFTDYLTDPQNPAVRSTSIIANNYLFQGREYDKETGLYNYRARYFDPQLARFLQTDPVGYRDSMNLYQALGQSPFNFVDPFGLAKKIALILGLSPGERNREWLPPGAPIPPNSETLLGSSLDVYYEKGPDYEALKQEAAANQYTLEVIKNKDLWEEVSPLTYQLKSNVVVGGTGQTIKGLLQDPEWGVIFVGHMAVERISGMPIELYLSSPRAPFEEAEYEQQYKQYISPPSIKNDFFLPLGCNSIFLDVPAGSNLSGGIIGYTELGTAEKAAPAFVREYMRSGEDFQKAIEAARKEYIKSRTAKDKATILSKEEWSRLSSIIRSLLPL